MIHVATLLEVIRPTTIAYEISEELGQFSDIEMTVISYSDSSVDNLEVDIDSTAVTVKTLGASKRLDYDPIRELRRLLKQKTFDLLHTHHNFVGSLACALCPLELPVINTEHANHRNHYSVIQNLINVPTLLRTDQIVANSQATLNSLYPHERAFIQSSQEQVIYNGVNMDMIESANGDETWKTDTPRVTTVGRLIPVKNQETLVRSFCGVLDKVPDAELVIVGNGPKRSALKETAKSNGILENVTLTGEISREEVYKILHHSDVFALPSYSEGFCVALVEGMASGCAPVVSDIPVLHEVTGDAAIFADPQSSEDFTAEITRLLRNRDWHQRYSDLAKKRAYSVFPIERTADQYRNLYQELTDNHK